MSDSLAAIADDMEQERRENLARNVSRVHAEYCQNTNHAGPCRIPDPLDAVSEEHARNEVRREANKRQVGGKLCGGGEIQHWDLAVMFKWNWAQYQITKYVMRYLDKNGLQDLEKAQHVLEKLIEEIKAGRMPEKNS